MIQEIMILKRNIINIRRILAPQRPVILELQNKHPAFIPQELNIYFDDVLDKKDKIVNQLDTALDYVEVLEQTNEALINRSTNKVIKVLAIFSVIPLPLQMIINYYGMNVSLPYQNQPHILLYINIALIATGAIMVGILIKKRWL